VISIELSALGISGWTDIDTTRLKNASPQNGIKQSCIFILFLNAYALNDPWILYELQLAISLGKKIVFVYETDPHDDGLLNCDGNVDISKAFGPNTPSDIRALFTPEVISSMLPFYHQSPFRQAFIMVLVSELGFEKDCSVLIDPTPNLPVLPTNRYHVFLTYCPEVSHYHLSLMVRLLKRNVNVYQNTHNTSLDSTLTGIRQSQNVVLIASDHVLENECVQAQIRAAKAAKVKIVIVFDTKAPLDSKGFFNFQRVFSDQAPPDLTFLQKMRYDGIPLLMHHEFFAEAVVDSIIRQGASNTLEQHEASVDRSSAGLEPDDVLLKEWALFPIVSEVYAADNDSIDEANASVGITL